MDHKTARTHARAGDGALERPLIIGDPSTVDAPAVMHVISADTTVANTIRYDTPSIGSDTIPIR